MLALYKIYEETFNAMVVYPYKVYNFESCRYECKKNSFMIFIPHERNKNYKTLKKTGFYRSTVKNISEYCDKLVQLQKDPSANNTERDVWVFAMYFDFMSYVVQRLGSHEERRTSLLEARTLLRSAVIECSQKFKLSTKFVRDGMYVIVNESYPAPDT